MSLLAAIKGLKKPQNAEARVLLLGLDGAGKTTLLKQICGEDPTQTAPTQGFNIKSVQHEDFKLNIWDIGGQQAIRQYWCNYLEACDALIFVVDSVDSARLQESSDELNKLCAEEKLAGVPVLVFANKQDLLQAVGADDIATKLSLADITDRTWQIAACSAKTGDGLAEGMEWLVSNTKPRGP